MDRMVNAFKRFKAVSFERMRALCIGKNTVAWYTSARCLSKLRLMVFVCQSSYSRIEKKKLKIQIKSNQLKYSPYLKNFDFLN